MGTKKTTGKETISLYSQRRSFEISRASFNCKTKNEIITNRGIKGEEYADQSEKNLQNIITSEKIYLDEDESNLKVNYNLRVVDLKVRPENVESPIKGLKIEAFIRNLKKTEVVEALARAYAYTIIVGVIGNRNRDNSTEVRTSIKTIKYTEESREEKELVFIGNMRYMIQAPYKKNQELSFEDKTQNIFQFENEQDQKNLYKLADLIKEGLINDNVIVELQVENIFVLNKGALIYPSELFIENKDNKVKKYYKIRDNVYGLTPEKIGNAIRRIDSFFEEYSSIEAISMEPTGGCSQVSGFLRKKNTIYNYLGDFFNYEEIKDISIKKEDFDEDDFLENLEEAVQHFIKDKLGEKDLYFIIGVMIRGGLFQNSKGKNNDS